MKPVFPGVVNELVTDIRQTLTTSDENYFICVTGSKPGIGKTSTAITVADKIDKYFTMTNFATDIPSFLEILKKLKKKKEAGKLRKGVAVIWDEAGVGRGSKEAMTKLSRVISKVTQTFRYLNCCIIFTAPSIGRLVKDDRTLLQLEICVMTKDMEKMKTICKWLFLQWNPRARNGEGKFYYHHPKIRRNGETRKITEVHIDHAPDKHWEKYKEIEPEFKGGYIDDAIQMHKQINSKENKNEKRKKERQEEVQTVLKEIKKKPKKYYGTKAFDVAKISVAFGISRRQAIKVKAAAELEGLDEKAKN